MATRTTKKKASRARAGRGTKGNLPRDRFRVFVADSVDGNAQNAQNVGPVVPDGARVLVDRFGGADEGTGDMKASTFALQWGVAGGGWRTIWGFSVASGTVDLALSELLVGDGARRLRLIRRNTSRDAKTLTAWVEARRVE